MVRKFRPLGRGDLEAFTELKLGLDEVEVELDVRGPWDLPEDYNVISSRRDSLYEELRALLDMIVE